MLNVLTSEPNLIKCYPALLIEIHVYKFIHILYKYGLYVVKYITHSDASYLAYIRCPMFAELTEGKQSV